MKMKTILHDKIYLKHQNHSDEPKMKPTVLSAALWQLIYCCCVSCVATEASGSAMNGTQRFPRAAARDVQQPKVIKTSRQSNDTEDESLSFFFLTTVHFHTFSLFGEKKITDFSHFHRTYNEKMTENQIHVRINNLHGLFKAETQSLRTSTELKAQCGGASESKEGKC